MGQVHFGQIKLTLGR